MSSCLKYIVILGFCEKKMIFYVNNFNSVFDKGGEVRANALGKEPCKSGIIVQFTIYIVIPSIG